MAETTYPYALAAAGCPEAHMGADHDAETPDP